jgi:hypothetical protein
MGQGLEGDDGGGGLGSMAGGRMTVGRARLIRLLDLLVIGRRRGIGRPFVLVLGGLVAKELFHGKGKYRRRSSGGAE